MSQHFSPAALPDTGYVRVLHLTGQKPVTPEQAKANIAAGRSPVRPRPGQPAIVPFSEPTLWRLVKKGEFPAPVKLSERVTAWRVEDVRAWMRARSM